MQTGGCGRKTTSSFRCFDVVLVKRKTSPCQVSVLAGQVTNPFSCRWVGGESLFPVSDAKIRHRFGAR